LLKKIEKLHYDFREAYGAARLSGELEKIGEQCSRHPGALRCQWKHSQHLSTNTQINELVGRIRRL
jgi:hypothetical protein